MTNPNLTEIAAVLDRSGSMLVVKKDTEGAFDGYIADQRSKPGEARLTLVQFADKVQTVYRSIPLAEVPPVIINPRGMTALWDAIGTTIADLEEYISGLGEDRRPGHVVVVILTDGEENRSRKWTKIKLRELIQQKTRQGWTFLYLGANQDAVFEGENLGIKSDYALTYDVGSMDVAVAAASGATTRARSGGPGGFTQADRDAAVGRDVTLRPKASVDPLDKLQSDADAAKNRNREAVERAKRNLNRRTP